MRLAGLAFAFAAIFATAVQAQTLNDYLGGWSPDKAMCAGRGPELIVIGEAKRGLAFWYTGGSGRPSIPSVASDPVAKISVPVKGENGDMFVEMTVSGGALTIANPAKAGAVDIAGGTLPSRESVTFVACDRPDVSNQAYWADCAGTSPNSAQFPPAVVARACTGLIDAGIRDPKRLSEAYRFRSIALKKKDDFAGALLDATAAVEFDPGSSAAKKNLEAIQKARGK